MRIAITKLQWKGELNLKSIIITNSNVVIILGRKEAALSVFENKGLCDLINYVLIIFFIITINYLLFLHKAIER